MTLSREPQCGQRHRLLSSPTPPVQQGVHTRVRWWIEQLRAAPVNVRCSKKKSLVIRPQPFRGRPPHHASLSPLGTPEGRSLPQMFLKGPLAAELRVMSDIGEPACSSCQCVSPKTNTALIKSPCLNRGAGPSAGCVTPRPVSSSSGPRAGPTSGLSRSRARGKHSQEVRGPGAQHLFSRKGAQSARTANQAEPVPASSAGQAG